MKKSKKEKRTQQGSRKRRLDVFMISNRHLSLFIITIIGQLCNNISQLAWTFPVVGAMPIHLEKGNMCLKESISYDTS